MRSQIVRVALERALPDAASAALMATLVAALVVGLEPVLEATLEASSSCIVASASRPAAPAPCVMLACASLLSLRSFLPRCEPACAQASLVPFAEQHIV